MKLPSINYLIQNAKDSFKRFPLTIISSLIAVIFGIYLIENGKDITNIFPYINIMLCMSIGIPLYFCVTIISNKKGFDKKSNLIINLFATLILVIIYFTLPNSESTHNTSLPYIKYTLYNITCHLLVSFIPFAFSKQLNAFWHYNKILFIRIWTSILYSGFIYVGLIIALTSLHLLFDIKIHEQLYFEIWVVTMCFFNTWFFVGGIPTDFDQLDNIYEYPKGLKTFSQYVLLPLLGLYLIILYTYGTKILILWDWPRGIVSYLIICVSVLGILAFLLLHPYGNQKENLWIKKASKGYYFMLFPLLIILFIAIFMRVNEYGITINRYIILLLGIWLTIVCLYTAIGKTNIKFIPTSLALMLILISFGPWGMFSISEKSQVNRLKNILEQSKILVGNKVENETTWIKDSLPNLHSNSELKNAGRLTDSLHNEVLSILDYLDDHHGFSLIREWYKQDIDSIVNLKNVKKKNSYAYSEAEIYMKTLGLNYEHINIDNKKTKIEYNASYNISMKTVTGYDYLVDFSRYNYGQEDNDICSFYIDSIEYNLVYSNKPTVKLLLKSKTDTVDFELEDLINKLKKEYGNNPKSVLPVSKMQLVNSGNKFEIKIEFHSIEMESEKNRLHINNLSGEIFIKKRHGD
jgi:hypothetical protein